MYKRYYSALTLFRMGGTLLVTETSKKVGIKPIKSSAF